MAKGKVYLIGAGPGDPGLLTIRGRELLESADLVLYDGLVNPLMLRMTAAVCERTARTRDDSGRIVPQSDVNQRLIDEAEAGKTVVRLKGGDPYIFGRGSEEAAALQQAGIEYEVIPGITAATAAGEYGGFSFTHRKISSAVAFVTGHEDPAKANSSLDYAALATFPGTLVFYMGLGRIASICSELVEHGKPATTPAAVICKASLPNQQVVTGALSNLAQRATQAELRPPSLIVVGECVDLRLAESWFEQRPLMGVSIGITRPAHQCDEIISRITRLSGQPVVMPLIEINEIDEDEKKLVFEQLKSITDCDWLVFTSVNGVEAFFQYLRNARLDARSLGTARIAAIGPSTSNALAQHSLIADVVPDEYRAESLAESLKPFMSGQRVLWVRANRGRDVLPSMLRSYGASVEELVVYRNDDVQDFTDDTTQAITDGGLGWIGLSSPSIAKRLAEMKDSGAFDFHDTKLAAISPVTAAAAESVGLKITIVAETYTWDGIIDAVCKVESREAEPRTEDN